MDDFMTFLLVLVLCAPGLIAIGVFIWLIKVCVEALIIEPMNQRKLQKQLAAQREREAEERAAREAQRQREKAEREQRQRVMTTMLEGKTLLPTGLYTWDVTPRTDMSRMFAGFAGEGRLGLTRWDTSHVRNMRSMFEGAQKLQVINLSTWNVKAVTDMSGMFRNCKGLQSLDLSSWDNSGVKDMSGMFQGCDSLRELTVGRGFSFNIQGRGDCALPFEVAVPDGKGGTATRRYWWMDASGKVYKSQRELPSGVATTYHRVTPFGAADASVGISAETTRMARLKAAISD